MACALLDIDDPMFAPILRDWRIRPSTADEVAQKISLAYIRSGLFPFVLDEEAGASSSFSEAKP
jgi:hypothetical protein